MLLEAIDTLNDHKIRLHDAQHCAPLTFVLAGDDNYVISLLYFAHV
jgi:hypothetical protein